MSMKLSKNTVIELWHELANIPTVMNGAMATVIDEDYLGWQAGTDVEEIWHWFDDQFADFGGVHVLMYENPQPTRKFQVQTPAGIIEVYAKHEGVDSEQDYPGVYVDFRHNREQLAGKELGDMIGCVEYNSCKDMMQVEVYASLEKEEPTFSEFWEDGIVCLPWLSDLRKTESQTFREFLDRNADDIKTLYMRDRNGLELDADTCVPDDTAVIDMRKRGGTYHLKLDFVLNEEG